MSEDYIIHAKIEFSDEIMTCRTYEQDDLVIKFLARHPFKEMVNAEGEIWQIVGINFASRRIMLRDFYEYEIDEILDFNGFRDKSVDRRWKAYLKKHKIHKTIKVKPVKE